MGTPKSTWTIAIAACASAFVWSTCAYAEFSAAIGGEHFQWKESGSPSVSESGMRLALDASWFSSRDPGWSAGLNVKWYDGSVDYDGANLFTGAPLSGTTDYRGIAPEARIYYRTGTNPLAFMGAVGVDHWERKLTSLQKETYNVVYVKFGAEYNAASRVGIMTSGGVKYPVSTHEDAHLPDIGFSENPALRPGKSPSLYATLGYRFTPRWDVIAYYDSFRFKASHVENAGGGFFVFQPKSDMDVIGVKIQHNFE